MFITNNHSMPRILLVAMGCMAMAAPAVTVAQEQPVPHAQVREKGWVTLSGTVIRLEQDYSSATSGDQLVLAGANGEKTILIGEQAAILRDKTGAAVVVTGVYKPAMRLQGIVTAVIEVRFIDRIDEKQEKDEKES